MPLVRLLPLLTALVALAGCGSAATADLPAPQTTPLPSADGAAPADITGRLVDVAEDGGRLGGAVGVGGRLAVAQASPDRLLLLDRDGRVRARADLPGPPQSAPIADGGDVLLGAGGRLLRIDPEDGRVVRTLPRRATAVARVAGGLATLDPRAGELTIRPEEGGAAVTAPIGPDATGLTAVGDGVELAVLDGRARTVTLRDGRTGRSLGVSDAGVAPAALASRGRWLWVTDTRGGALLVFSVARRELELTRRVFLPGGPFAIVVRTVPGDEQESRRLQVVESVIAEVAELTSNGRPNQIARRATPPDPRAVAVIPATSTLAVTTADGRVQLVDLPPADPDQPDDVQER